MNFYDKIRQNKYWTLIKLISIVLLSTMISFSYANAETSDKVYRFAGDYNYPPYEYRTPDGNFLGFNVDVMRAIAENQGIKIEIIPMEWNEAVWSLENGRVDGLIGMSQTEKRKNKYTFISPTVQNEQVMFVQSENIFINNIEDLEGLLVGYQEEDLGREFIEDMKNIIRRPYPDQQAALMDLTKGKVDTVIGNKLVGTYYMQKMKLYENIKTTGDVLEATLYGPVVQKDNTELAMILEAGLKEIKASNSYDNIYRKWFGSDRNVLLRFIDRNRFLVFVLVALFFISIGFLILYTRILKRQVDKRTKELKMANMDLQSNQNEIYNLAFYDPITGLANRSKFVRELEDAIKNIKIVDSKIAVLFLDLDKFKHVNDTLGHNVGDEVLRVLSKRLSEVIGERGFLAKAGGDEYFILVDNVEDEKHIKLLALDIIEDFKKPYFIKKHNLYLTTSIGIAMYPEAGLDGEDLIKNADLALYKAKEMGGNSYYIYGKEIQSKGLEKMILLNQLRQGLENEELMLYYQPQIDIKTGKLTGLEALVRWQHPSKGIVYPDQFIGLAEESGLIIPMGAWILNKACTQMKEWVDKGRDGIISVNISPRQFQHSEFLNEVRDALKTSQLDSKHLTIEITETVAIRNMKYTLDILQELKRMGITVSIDDFGTGYSSLSYLNEMNVDELKIDRSFIWDIEKNPKNKSISNAMILLAKQLEIKVTAEGVENLEQLNILKELNCDIAQGYYFSKPIAIEEVDALWDKF